MRVVVTGGAGLVGRAVVRLLCERGDGVVALVRDPQRASFLADLGAELVASDLSDVGAITESLRGADALIHAAGSYRIGIPASERPAMWDANVGTTTRILDAVGGGRHAASRLRVDRQHLRQHARRHRRRDISAGPGRGVPELV
jgi:nucleoside-diphosphate-sugar epimerase